MNHLLAIRVFGRVVETGSFTRAADSLQMPKATVTKLVQTLETHLRVKLLLRTTRRVAVTADGAAYYEQTSRLLNQLADVETSLAGAQSRPRGRLRVDVGASMARHVLIPALQDFYARYPEVQIDLGVSDRPVDLIGDNVDCVIRAGTLQDDALVARRIAELPWVTCATPGYLARRGMPQHPRDLAGGYCIVSYFSPRNGRRIPLRFQRNGERIEIAPPSVLAVNDSNAHVTAGIAGVGLIQTFRFMVRPHIESGELVPVLDDWQPEPESVYLAYPFNRHLSMRLRVFADWVTDLFADRLDNGDAGTTAVADRLARVD